MGQHILARVGQLSNPQPARHLSKWRRPQNETFPTTYTVVRHTGNYTECSILNSTKHYSLIVTDFEIFMNNNSCHFHILVLLSLLFFLITSHPALGMPIKRRESKGSIE